MTDNEAKCIEDAFDILWQRLPRLKNSILAGDFESEVMEGDGESVIKHILRMASYNLTLLFRRETAYSLL